MNNIIEFIKNHYEWLFSGIGLAIVTMLAKCVVKVFIRTKNIVNSKVIRKIKQKIKVPPKKMTIVNDDGSVSIVEVILAFEFKDTHQEYVLYTMHEKDKHHNITVYVSEVVRDNGDVKLIGIDDENDWNRVIQVLRELADADVDAPLEYDEFGIEVI